MKKIIIRVLCLILNIAMLLVYFPATVLSAGNDAVYTDYSVSPEFAAKYPAGVIRFYDSGITVEEGGKATLKLIRTGGTRGKVSVELKAIDVSAKYGVDYTVEVMQHALVQSDDYTGTLTETYLEQIGEDFITSDTILTDTVYKGIIGYKEETAVSEDDRQLLHDVSVALTADKLGISADEAEKLIDLSENGTGSEEESDGGYKSPLHELKDSVLNEKTAPNGMITSDMLGIDGLIGDNKGNLAASSIYADAAGASLRVVFEDGENEKTIVIKAFKDGEYEPQEAASLGICNPEGGAELGDIIGVSVVIDSADELAPSAIGFDTKTVTVSSDAAAAAIEIVRTGCLNDYAEISLKTIEGNARAGEDYLPINTTSVFYPGEERKAVVVPLKTSVYDQTEVKNLGLKLGLESGSATLGNTEAVINITPQAATNAQLAKAGKTAVDGWIVLPLDKIKCSGSEAVLLFSEITDLDLSYLGSVDIEVDFTVKDSGNKYTRERWLNDVANDYSFSAELNYSNNIRNTTTERNIYGLSVYGARDVENQRVVRNLFAGESTTLSARIGFTDSRIGDNEKYENVPLDKYYLSIQETRYSLLYTAPYDSTVNIKKPGNTADWNNWHNATWDNIQIDEVRIRPYQYEVRGESDVKGEYRMFEGTDADSIVNTVTYNAGTFNLPDSIHRGFEFSCIEYALKSKAVERYAKVEYVLSIKNYTGKSTGALSKKPNEVFSLYDREELLTPDDASYDLSRYYYYYITPVVRGENVGFITVEDYDKDKGALQIGGKTYRNENVASSEWREGDELYLYVESLYGYKCNEIRITRRDGSQEYVAPGEKVILTKGMSVKPILCDEDIQIEVKWAYPGMGGYESMSENLRDYVLTSDHNFTDNGNGTYTFSNMIPGDVVTLYLVAKNQNDTSAVIAASYLETLQPGQHTITLVTDKGSSNIILNVIPADDPNEYKETKYKVDSGVQAYRKKGTDTGLTVVAKSNGETVTAVKIDGNTLSQDNYEAVKGFLKNKTGFWTRTTVEGEKRLNDDVRFLSCIGDAYAFQVDDHDMVINYFCYEKSSNDNGALVRGRVVTNGGTIKRPSTVTVTAGNVDEVGIPVKGAKIYVASGDPNDTKKIDGVWYYTNAETDENGYFTVYLPSYVVGLGYCISISVNDRIYQNVSVFQVNGTTVYQLPYQNRNFQIDRMTVGSDMDTTKIYVDENRIKLGVHTVIASGYRAQKLVFKSYDSKGNIIKEWNADPSPAEDWTYESEFIPEDCLKEGGRLTVEIYDQYGKGQGEYDTGYTFFAAPKTQNVVFPQFDPLQSVTLPIIGDVTTKIDFGSGSCDPVDASKTSTTDISSAGKTAYKHPLEITFGAAKLIKLAVKNAQKIPGYKDMDVQTRTSYILHFIKTPSESKQLWSSGQTTGGSQPLDDWWLPDDWDVGDDWRPDDWNIDDSWVSPDGMDTDWDTVTENDLVNKPAVDGVINFTYSLGAYIGMYSQDGKFYIEGVTLYANLGLTASRTKQFVVYGVPLYVKMDGTLNGEFLIHSESFDGNPIQTAGDGYFNLDYSDLMETAGEFKFTIRIELGAGVGNPKVISLGVSGLIELVIDYQPWKDGAGIVTFSIDIDMNLIGIKIKYSIFKTSYGMFKTSGYNGAMDFSGVANRDKFVSSNSVKLLMAYTDENSHTEIYGSYENRPRGSSLNNGNYAMSPAALQDEYERTLAEKKIEGVISTASPILVPINGAEKILYLRLDDDSTRGDNDFSSVAYSIIDWNGNETEPVYLESDSTFDFNLRASQIGNGKTLVVWSDLDKSYGDTDPESLGEALNHADLSYCIFDENGVPGDVRKLTSDYGYEGLPSIAYDEATGKTFIAYVSTDYQTEGIEFGEDNLDEIGNFLYNSYSTVCFKVLDVDGEIIKEYTSAENNYAEFESANCIGLLNGMRYLNTQHDNRVSQSTIYEITSAASDGTVYTVYSLDSDRSTVTDSDRDLYVVTCDLDSMEQSEPILISSKETADTNPQLITYNGRVQMYWNNNGKINCSDVKSYLENTQTYDKSCAGVEGMEKLTNAASSYTVSVQPDGKLCIVWIDWDETENGKTPALYFREYDPEYGTYTDENGIELISGQWGAITKLVSVGEGQDISEFSYLGQGRKMMLSYLIKNRDSEETAGSFDSVLTLLKGGNRQELSMNVYPKYPVPGETATISITAKNTASLPSKKITVKAELIRVDGVTAEIGTRVFEEHLESDGKVIAVYDDFVMPDIPYGYKVRVYAWDDDLDGYPVVEEFCLPYSYDLNFSERKLDAYNNGLYELSFNSKNAGNKDFAGGVAVGYTVTEGEGENASSVFKPLSEIMDLKLNPDEETTTSLIFEAPVELYDEEGVCELELAVCDANGYQIKKQAVYLYRPVIKRSAPSEILTSEEGKTIELDEGQTFSLEGRITPYEARGEYHLTYTAADPGIASVDAQGNITANKAGNTTVTVSVVKNQMSMFVSSDQRGTDGAGVPLIIDESGRIAELGETIEETSVLTKTVEITVTEHTHDLTLVPAKDPTETEPGNKAYYICTDCGKWFEDEAGSVEITNRDSVIIPAGGTDPNNTPVSPGTGNNSHLGLWITLIIIFFCGLAATLVIVKKKRIFRR